MESKVFDLIAKEQHRQDATIELIASENFVSENIMRAVGSCLTNKYSEGYPATHRSGNRGRYYGGCQYVDELEEYCCEMWQKVFQTDYHVNVQPHSGTNANIAAYLSVLKPGDTVLSMSLDNGGHLSHGSPVNISGKIFNFIHYGANKSGWIDTNDFIDKLYKFNPKLVVIGASAYSRKKIITTYTEYDEDGKIKSQSVTETPYPEDDCDLDCECCDGAEADEDDDDAVYQLTPKGIACLALLRTGLVESIEDPRIDGFWELFQADMDALGYTQEVEE